MTLFWLKRDVRYGELSYLMISLSFLIFILIKVINEKHNFYFYLSCLLVACDGVSTATIQSKIMAMASIRGDKAIQNVLIGQGLVGLTVSASDVFFKVISVAGHDVLDPFLIYFSFAFVMSIVCLLTYTRLVNTTMLSVYETIDDNQPIMGATDDCIDVISEENNSIDNEQESHLSEAKYHVITCFLALFVTLFVFPATTSLIQPMEDLDDKYYIALFVPLGFFLYNLGDILGRLINKHPHIYVLLAGALSRIGFIAFFPILYSYEMNYRDIYFFMGLFLLGLSNGYIANGSMMLASRKYRNEKIGKIMNFSMLLGCVVGSCGSVVLANCIVYK